MTPRTFGVHEDETECVLPMNLNAGRRRQDVCFTRPITDNNARCCSRRSFDIDPFRCTRRESETCYAIEFT